MRCWLLLLLFLAAPLSQAVTPINITHAEVRDDGTQDWQNITLPDHWPDTRPDMAGAVWYRLNVDIRKPEALLGIYLKRACNNAWVYANGNLLYSGGGPWEGPRVHRMCHVPVLAAWPRTAQQAGRNEILIRVYSEASGAISSEQRKGFLSKVVVDRWQVLQPQYERERDIRLDIPRMISALMAFIALTLFLIWWRVRREHVYLHFALAMAAGAIGIARVFVTAPGIDNIVMERIVPAMVVLICLGVMGCLIELYSLRTRLYRLWWVLGLLSLVILALCPPRWLHATAISAFLMGALIMGVPLAQLMRQVLRNPVREHKLFYGSTTLLLGAGIHDLLVQIEVITFNDRPLIQNVLPVLLVGFVFRLMARHAEALTIAENSRAELEQRVLLITREIESSYEHSVGLEKDRAAQEERERIARDLHDDLGARLLTLVHRSSDEKASESAREALSDLRLLIGHLNAPEGELDDAISDWRAETSERCDAAGRQLQWHADNLPGQRLGTRQKITLGRLLREAVTNILKHTDSPDVAIALHITGGHLHITVTDSAQSAPVVDWKAGNGLRNLKMRASQIGARLQWDDLTDANGRKTGTCLRAELPLSALDSPDTGASPL